MGRRPADVLAVVIEPAQAFGTGAHATTRLCIELLTELPRGGLLDVGCGSGVSPSRLQSSATGPFRRWMWTCLRSKRPWRMLGERRRCDRQRARRAGLRAPLRRHDGGQTSRSMPFARSRLASSRHTSSRPGISPAITQTCAASSGFGETSSTVGPRTSGRRFQSKVAAKWRRSPSHFSAARCPTPMRRRYVSACSPTGTRNARKPPTWLSSIPAASRTKPSRNLARPSHGSHGRTTGCM